MRDLEYNKRNLVTFVLIDSDRNEVSGLGSGFTVQVAQAGGAFADSLGTKAEMGSGWYSYYTTKAETRVIGPVSIKITGAGIEQQNLECVVKLPSFASTVRWYY